MPVRTKAGSSAGASSPATLRVALTSSDGATDDRAAFVAAISAAAGLPVWVKPGTAALSARVDLPDGTAGLQGAGRGSTILKNTEAGNTNRVLCVESAAKMTLRAFTAIGTATARNDASIGIQVNASTDILIDDVEVGAGVSAGILVHKSSRVRVTNCHVHDTKADGIHLTDGNQNGTTYTDFSVIGNHCENTGDDGIAVVSYGDALGSFPQATFVRRVAIVGNTVVNSSSGGIANHGGGDVTITGNVIDTCAANGISVDGEGSYNATSPERTVIMGNVIRNPGQLSVSGSWNGVNVQAKHYNTQVYVADNFIENPFARGFNGSAARVAFRGNQIRMVTSGDVGAAFGSTSSGTVTVDDLEIVGNHFYGCAQNAISVVAPSDNHATRVVISGNVIVDGNGGAGANHDAIFCQNIDHLSIYGNTITNPLGDYRSAIFLTGCDHVDIGPNSFPDNDPAWISLTSCTDVLMPMIRSTNAPADTTTYRAGQTWLRTSTGKFYVFDGTTWQVMN